MCFCVNIFAQVDSLSLNNAGNSSDSINIQLFKRNLTRNDSLPVPIAQRGIAKIAAKQDLDDVVEYGSKDSTELDNKIKYLDYGEMLMCSIKNIRSRLTIYRLI